MLTLPKSHWLLCRPQSEKVVLCARALGLLVLDEVDDDEGLGEDLGGDLLLTDSAEVRMFFISKLSEELEVLERLRECIFSWTLTLILDFFWRYSFSERPVVWFEGEFVIRREEVGRVAGLSAASMIDRSLVSVVGEGW